MQYFLYTDAETDYLKKKDKRLAAAIERIGPIQRSVNPDLFTALISSIVSQQISSKAGETVWNRMCSAITPLTPQALSATSEETIQSFGMSFRKARYIQCAARAVCNGDIDLDSLRQKTDDEVCRILSSLPGIGTWTAEMLMLFSMNRKNIFSYNDLAIHRGLRILYGHKKSIKRCLKSIVAATAPTAALQVCICGILQAKRKPNKRRSLSWFHPPLPENTVCIKPLSDC